MNAATYGYLPITGERDQAGNLRVKDPNSPNVGFGSRPFFDDGAFEYIIQNPPVVDAVDSVSNVTGSVVTTNIYGVGTIAGTNQLPQAIQVDFNDPINQATLNGNSVILEASGGDGQLRRADRPDDQSVGASLLRHRPQCHGSDDLRTDDQHLRDLRRPARPMTNTG